MWLVRLCLTVVSANSVFADGAVEREDRAASGNSTAAIFRHKYITSNGGINDHHFDPSFVVTATSHVGDTALQKASLDVSYITRNMPIEVFKGLASSKGIGLFSMYNGMTVYPENKNLADTPACRGRCDGQCRITCTADNRKWSTVSALTYHDLSVIIDLNVLCDPWDIYRRQENLLAYELARLVLRHMPKQWNDKVTAAYNKAHSNALWTLGQYGMSSAEEYWCTASSAFFMTTTRTDVTSGLNMCGTSHVCSDEAAARSYIKQHDPALYEVLLYAYTNNRPEKLSGLSPCL